MKILNLTGDSSVYTSNVYLVTGTWNAIEDVNTLVDVGRDPSVIRKINNASTGVGKHRAEQVVLTHSHYDHASLLPQIREIFNPVVYAFSQSLKGVDQLLKHGDVLKLGDRMFEVIYMPGHSNDSICLYCKKDGVLFAGDSSVVIRSTDGSYEEGFIRALEMLCRRDIRVIYFGHGSPAFNNCNKTIRSSLENVKKAGFQVNKA